MFPWCPLCCQEEREEVEAEEEARPFLMSAFTLRCPTQEEEVEVEEAGPFLLSPLHL